MIAVVVRNRPQSEIVACPQIRAALFRTTGLAVAFARPVEVIESALLAPDAPADAIANQHFVGGQCRSVEADDGVLADGYFHTPIETRKDLNRNRIASWKRKRSGT